MSKKIEEDSFRLINQHGGTHEQRERWQDEDEAAGEDGEGVEEEHDAQHCGCWHGYRQIKDSLINIIVNRKIETKTH